jgi:serine/threonine-protein kinase RsbW
VTETGNITHILEVDSRTELLGDMRRFVTDAAREAGFGDADVGSIELAIDEACTNIIKHAYRYDPNGRIEIRTVTIRGNTHPNRFVIEILDSGIPFDAHQYTAPDMGEYFRKLRHGGLGIVLIRKLMDEVEYDIHPGRRNTIRLVKYLPA